MDENTILSVKDLVTQFKTSDGLVTAVNHVSFDMKKNKVLGLVGESGCGKSVTSLSVMRLHDPKLTVMKGDIEFEGKNLLAISDKEMRKIRGNQISMIFQEPMTALNPLFTIGSQLSEVLTLHQGMKDKKKIRQAVVDILNKVGIPRAEKVVDEYPHQLSGGMRQRVMIAMALLCNPKILIADEPTTALDVTIQAQVLEVMKALKDEYEMSILFITHDLGVIAEMVDDVIIMYAGRIVEQGTVEEIFHNPMHQYTIGLMDSRPSQIKKGEKLHCIPGMVPTLAEMPDGCAFAPRCPYATDECRKAVPELVEMRPGHMVRCLHPGKEA